MAVLVSGGHSYHPASASSALLVHKMRNILEKVRKPDYEAVKAGAQAIYLAESRPQAVTAFTAFGHGG